MRMIGFSYKPISIPVHNQNKRESSIISKIKDKPHLKSEERNYDCIRLLLDHGADFNVVDKWGTSPISKATEYGDEIMINLFK